MADDFKKLPMTRRGFLGVLGGGLATLFGGGSKLLKGTKVAEEIIKPAMQAEGMPSWFPLLVDKIRSKGKITRQSDFVEAKEEGINMVEYVLKDKSLPNGEIRMTEDLNTGEISIWGRGDDFQQVDLTYTPGDRIVNVESGRVTEAPHSFNAEAQTKSAGRAEERGDFLGNQDTTPELMGTHPVDIKKDGTFHATESAELGHQDIAKAGSRAEQDEYIMKTMNKFEAGEFAKGDPHDFENFGTIDDLKGDLSSWEKIATVGSKQSGTEIEEAIRNFINRNKKPIEPDFAEGGRVGFLHGGIVAKRRDPFYNGMGSLFKERV